METIEAIKKQMNEASELLKRLASLVPLPKGIAVSGGQAMAKVRYDKATISQLEDDINNWQYVTITVLDSCFGTGKKHSIAYEKTKANHHIYVDAKEDLTKEVRNGFNILNSVIAAENIKAELNNPNPDKKTMSRLPKIFISHKKEDQDYAEALVNLINFIIGPDGDKIFCSSIPGYGIRQSRDILDDLKAQFDNYEIYMIIIHSPRYYKSVVCLNEMGASWAIGTQFSSFMTKDCKYEMMQGVINDNYICININDEEKTLNGRLNEFKDELLAFFDAPAPVENKWENERSRFVKAVTSLNYESEPLDVKKPTDLFKSLYMPAFEHVFEVLDIDHFQSWAYPCAIASDTILRKDIFDNLEVVVNYIKGRTKHKDYSHWDSLLHNLGLLLNDFNYVFSQHAVQYSNGQYYVEKFYKFTRRLNNDIDLEAYTQHIYLVSDLLFELARLGNLIIGKIREQYPEYKKELGLLQIDNRFSTPDLMYREDEISDAPYPGLDEFIKLRLTRETHYGNNPNIEASGYEQKNK